MQDHWYEADGYFTAGRPPWLADEVNGVDPVSGAKLNCEHAFMAINRTDPDAIWLYQGWILPGAGPLTEGLVASVQPGRVVVSDMRCEDPHGCLWTDHYSHGGSFYGAPFIWGT